MSMGGEYTKIFFKLTASMSAWVKSLVAEPSCCAEARRSRSSVDLSR